MSQTLLRVRDGHGASVSFSELLFDLIYVLPLPNFPTICCIT